MKTKNEICPKCLGTGQFFNGEEFEDCTSCDGLSNIEELDNIFDLEDLIEDPEDADPDNIDNW